MSNWSGPRTEAVFLKPAGAKGRLPAILALHDHGGNKFLGWRKIARTDDKPCPIAAAHQENYYGGVAWANEIAKRGYAVLVHDTFPFASRRVRVSEVSERVRQNGIDPEPDDADGIKRYNAFAAAHEHIMEKSLISAGTTWPGVYAAVPPLSTVAYLVHGCLFAPTAEFHDCAPCSPVSMHLATDWLHDPRH